MNENIAVKVNNVTKTFKIPSSRKVTFKSYFTNPFEKTKIREFTALKDLSFAVNKGEFFSVIGKNGAGKSTLLKIIAKIYEPDKGSVNIKGSLVPFLELGVGFQHELSARENVYLNGVILGLKRKEIDKHYNDIIKFSGLKKFQDVPIKNFSSGMRVRLGFSIAIQVRSDILVLDEVLAVGDRQFRKKCHDFFKDIKGERTIIYVSHSLSTVEEYSDRVLYLKKNNKYEVGEPDKMIKMYESDTD